MRRFGELSPGRAYRLSRDRKRICLLVVLLITMSTHKALAQGAPCSTKANTSRNANLPAELQTFFLQRWSCVHFRGEVGSGNAEREEFISARINRDCLNQNKLLRALRQKFRADLSLSSLLALLHDNVEDAEVTEIQKVQEVWCK